VAMRGDVKQCLNLELGAPIAEEGIFRYIIFGRLFTVGGPFMAYLASSATFGWLHRSEEASKELVGMVAGFIFLCFISFHGTISYACYPPLSKQCSASWFSQFDESILRATNGETCEHAEICGHRFYAIPFTGGLDGIFSSAWN